MPLQQQTCTTEAAHLAPLDHKCMLLNLKNSKIKWMVLAVHGGRAVSMHSTDLHVQQVHWASLKFAIN